MQVDVRATEYTMAEALAALSLALDDTQREQDAADEAQARASRANWIPIRPRPTPEAQLLAALERGRTYLRMGG